MVESDSNTASNNGIANIASPFLFADTVHRLLSAFADHGIKVFVTIDQQTEASAAGLGLPPTTLIVFGNPKAGTPLMLARRASGIDLPLKVLVVEAVPGQVTVIFNAGAYIISRHSLPAELATNLAPVDQLIVSVLRA